MVAMEKYKKVHEMAMMGFSERGIGRETGLDRGTVKKYLGMDEDAYCRYRAACKERAKLLDGYRCAIETMLEEYTDIPAAVVYDKLLEADGRIEPSKRTVRLYVANLREELGIPTQARIRQFCEVEELPPGKQAQVDMGLATMRDAFGKAVKVYIFCMVMSHSRQKFVYFQLRPFNGEDFVYAHDLAFRYYGGRTQEIVYDQDRVLTVSENGGNVLHTECFESYKQFAGFSVWLCHGYDPQSKGKIEAVVKYVKNHFLKYRVFYGIDALNSDGLAWLDRTANGQKHETTKLVPKVVFAAERKSLADVPALSKPIEPQEAIVRPTNVIHYKQNRYCVPRGTYWPGRKARIDVVADKVVFSDAKTGELLAEHPVAVGVTGKLISLPKGRERNRGTKNDETRQKVLAGFSNCPQAADYVGRILEKFPRYNKEQLAILRKLQEAYTPDELTRAVTYCTERDLYAADEFRATLVFFRGEDQTPKQAPAKLPTKYGSVTVQTRPISEYSRLAQGGGAQ
jgi:transposase